jgi:hypothetical protein
MLRGALLMLLVGGDDLVWMSSGVFKWVSFASDACHYEHL